MSDNETVAQMLRSVANNHYAGTSPTGSVCSICGKVIGRPCYGGSCSRWMEKLADMVEAEVEEASAARCTAYIDNLARLGRVPARNRGETLEKWLGRCYLPVPRYTDGEPVGVGSVSEYGTVAMVEVQLTDGGYGNWTLYTEEQADPVEGTLSERVPRGLLVEGKPVRKDDSLWFGRDKVTVTDVDGLSDTIFTDYLTEDGEGGWIPYPFESAELSWERPAPKVLDADGVPIEVGDWVYTEAGLRRKVAKVGTERCQGMEDWDGSPWVMLGNGSWMHAHDITHREPDSLERLRDDIAAYNSDFTEPGSILEDALDGWAQRLTALMERGAE